MESPETTNLYAAELEGPFAKYCAGGTDNDGNMESCITVAELHGGGYAIGDSKPEGAGRELRMSKGEITSFARKWLSEHEV